MPLIRCSHDRVLSAAPFPEAEIVKGALAGALSGSALLLGAAILGRLLGRPLVPDWVMVASFLGALAVPGQDVGSGEPG